MKASGYMGKDPFQICLSIINISLFGTDPCPFHLMDSFYINLHTCFQGINTFVFDHQENIKHDMENTQLFMADLDPQHCLQ